MAKVPKLPALTHDAKRLREIEDQADARDFKNAMRRWERSGRKTISWEQVEKELAK